MKVATPTTAAVAYGYSVACGHDLISERYAEFDAWLKEHDAALIEALAEELAPPNLDALMRFAKPARTWLMGRARRLRDSVPSGAEVVR